MKTNIFSAGWKQIVDVMTEGVMVVNPQGRIVYINPTLQDLLQYSANELIGADCSILECTTCFDTRKNGNSKYCTLFQQGVVKKLRCAFKRKDGQYVQFYKNATVLHDKTGNIIAGVENLTDISPLLAREQEIITLKRQLHIEESFFDMIGSSTKMRAMYQLIESAALSDAPVLIHGESGTGKEMVAKALFRLSRRSEQPFIKVNCAALNENLLESELFGHVRGAFTGAERMRTGRFEAAHMGCILLDEIGDMPLRTQTKLLRVLQEKELERVGDNQTISIDVRVIAATNKNLAELMFQEKFRDDLYYRINVIPIHVPPLRERKEDIPAIIRELIAHLRAKTGKPINGLSKNAMDILLHYMWPGNVRELINVLEYTFVLCAEGEITRLHLPPHLAKISTHSQMPANKKKHGKGRKKREEIEMALQSAEGNRTAAAKMLGVSRVTLWKWMKKHQMNG